MRKWAPLVFALLPVMVTGDDEAKTRGAAIFSEFCQACHGVDRSGLLHFEGQLDALNSILEGERENMPDFFGVFSEEEVTDLYAYLNSD